MFTVLRYLFLVAAVCPFIYYLLTLWTSWRYFRGSAPGTSSPGFTPPISNLKPVRGLDADAYENFASFCRQDYPDYELLFCISSPTDPVVPVLEKLKRDFPECRIRVITGSGRQGSNDKVAKLARLVEEARHEVLVINDSDVRVAPDYLRRVVAPLKDRDIGAVTCFYASAEEKTFAESLHNLGMMSEFYAGILVARMIDGVKFTIGKTIVTTRSHLAAFGGYERLENRPGDDLLIGRFIAASAYRVELLPYTVLTSSSYTSMADLLQKRLRWIVVMRHMRPWGHFGLLFTYGLAWAPVVGALDPPWSRMMWYLAIYAALRVAMTWMIGIRGLKRPGLWKRIPLIPVWDAVAFCIWLTSFTRSSLRWRDAEYYIRDGQLVRVVTLPAED